MKDSKSPQEIVQEIIEGFKNHPSIIKLRNQSAVFDKFSFEKVNEEEITKFLKNIDTGKSTGEDNIPPKLVKLAFEYLAKPLTDAINSYH